MGLEKRGNNYYLYEKRRHGGRVVSIYRGKREFAESHSVRRTAAIEVFKRESEEIEALDHQIDSVAACVGLAADALFLANGYHQHSRTWRRINNAAKT